MNIDQINIEAFFGHLLEDFKADALSKEQAVGGLVAFTVALNRGDIDEARRWAITGRKLVRDLMSTDHVALLLSRAAGAVPN